MLERMELSWFLMGNSISLEDKYSVACWTTDLSGTDHTGD